MTIRFITRIFLILFSVPLLLFSCMDKGSLPSYFYLSEPRMAPINAVGEQRIEDYWVYLGNELLGVFHPGNIMPVLGDGNHELAFYPGVRANGMRDDGIIYPFLEAYRTQVQLCGCSAKDTIFPEFKYKPATKFSFTANFDPDNSFLVDYDKDDQTSMKVQSDSVFNGTGAGQLTVTKDNPLNFVGTSSYYNDFESNSLEVYLEINYKGSAFFQIGLDFINSNIYSTPQTLINLYPSAEWKKVYISLASLTNNAGKNDGCRLLLNAYYNSNDPLTTQNIFVDNIKLVHF